ncbi:calpain-7, partial [Hyalella azteca]|uniref:Calpain-7 n=1 Tax=Hyalella azteca TaxID=294128 RepID=A0A979FSW7_HYAAZ
MADNGEKSLLEEAVSLAQQATKFDSENSFSAAVYYYRQSACLLKQTLKQGAKIPSIEDKIEQYLQRADQLENQQKEKLEASTATTSGESVLGRASFLLHSGLDQDSEGNTEEAITFYAEAAELCIKTSAETTDDALKTKLRHLADQALTRAEKLKGTSPDAALGESGFRCVSRDSATNAAVSRQVSGGSAYTREELLVLRSTSTVNGREYVPFMAIDLKEKFAYSLPFTDKDGFLLLAPKQKEKFARWARPEELSRDPKMIELIDCFSIQQTCVSDCSFVASIAVSALYEKRFKKRLITDIIFPKNRNGDPVYNPCGKYMIKLHINGIARKIIIDDYLPVGRHNQLLCSFSSNKNEFWISLVEKAYMKVMGGYDFPGSNSNIDLYALTGWVPERLSMSDKDFNKDATFRKIYDRFHKGDVLVTVATGDMTDAEADRAGLFMPYAMLDVTETMGKRLFMLKNPWSHLRWKGNYSELDTKNWTPELCKALNFDPKSAQMFDNGVFWIDYDSLIHFFDVIYMNWNPALFTHTYCTHRAWSAGMGPAKDLYNLGDNPQYRLEVRASAPTAVWVLLTRHITDIEDFRHNKEYITLLVYKTGGRRVFYPSDPLPYIEGVRINSPHYLCKLVLGAGTQRFTLVVSQYEKQRTIAYSLRVYSTCPFSFNKIKDTCIHQHEGVRINSPHYLCKLVLGAGTQRFTLVVSQYEKQRTIAYSLRVYSTCPFSFNKIKDTCIHQHE